MNSWYIDRSKNFLYDSLYNCLKLIYDISKGKDSLDVNVLIQEIKNHPELGIAEGNINAAITRFRDHGLLSKQNIIGDSAIDFIEGRINESELVIDLFLKRPASKHNSVNIKPFVLICKVFDFMIDILQDQDDIFLTSYECKEYLCPINDLNDITYEYVEKIINERNYSFGSSIPRPRVTLENNEDTNFSIWFKALNSTPVFVKNENSRMILIPNLKQKEFFKYISVNSDEISETPTDSKDSLYGYYCSRDTGLNEILPSILRDDIVNIDEEEIPALFEYLFGYKRNYDVDFNKYFKSEYFGIFFPFITMPGLVIRKLYYENSILGDMLYSYISNGVIYEEYLRKLEHDQFEFSNKNFSMKDKFKNWLIKNNYKQNTINNYLPEIEIVSKIAIDAGLISKSIYQIYNLDELNLLIEELDKNDEYSNRKLISHNTNTAAMKQYKYFLNDFNSKGGKIMNYTNDVVPISGGFNKIYYGVPGSGKSYIVNKSFNEDEYKKFRTTFHPEYNNSDFIGQIIPMVKNNVVEYVFHPGAFTLALKYALENKDKKVCLIIEEINRGNSSAIFGDIFQLLDRDKTGKSKYYIYNGPIIDYLNDNNISLEKIYIPSNMWIVATMNTSDQNVFTLDTAFKRRWKMEYIRNVFADNEESIKLKNKVIPFGEKYPDVTWEKFVKKINNHIISDTSGINGEDKQLGMYFVSTEEIDNPKEFAEKILSYLWEDVAKLNTSYWFGSISSYDELIDKFNTSYLDVFNSLFEDEIKVDNEYTIKSVGE